MRIEAKEAPAPSMELAEEPGTALALIDDSPAALVYAPGALTALVDRLKAEVRGQLSQLDVSVPKDRQRMISLSARVATAKVKLDKMGDSLIEEHRAVVTAVNADRKIMRDELDAFKIEVRKPVTDLENAEKERVAGHEAALKSIAEAGALDRPLNLDEIEAKFALVNQLSNRDWQEFSVRAAGAKALAWSGLQEAADRARQAIAQREALERQRAEEQERAVQEREAAAAKAATEAAQRRAEEQARLAAAAAEKERQRVENEKAEAEARAKQAEAQRIAQEQLAERLLQEAEARRAAEEQAAARRAQEAAERAKREQEAAIEAERGRVAAEKKREAEEAEKRAKNRAHLASINREVLASLAKLDVPEESGKIIIAAIAKGEIPHVTINY